MKRLNMILAVVLAAQLLLAGALAWNSRRYTIAKPGQPLVSFDRAKVDRIVIDAGQEGSITLRKNTRGWNLPSREHFPADRSKVESFLATLADLKPRLPVAVTEDAIQRFHVGAKKFERRITLKQGKQALATLYLGDSSGPSQVFARAREGKAVYEVRFGLWQASTEPDQWMDRNLLQHKPDDIARIDLPTFTLQRKNGHWRLDGLGGKADTDEEAADRVVDRLANLTYEDVKGKADKSAGEPAPELSYTLTLKNGKSLKYRFSKAAQGKGYLLRTSASDFVFEVSQEEVDGIRNLKRDTLVKKAKDEANDKAAAGTARSGNSTAAAHS